MAKTKRTNTTTRATTSAGRAIYRQGDVLFERVREIPADAMQRTSRVLVEGEVTGHAHRVAEASQATVHVVSGTELLYLQCAAATEIVHEEHRTVELPAGVYRVSVQREYSPEQIRRVID